MALANKLYMLMICGFCAIQGGHENAPTEPRDQSRPPLLWGHGSLSPPLRTVNKTYTDVVCSAFIYSLCGRSTFGAPDHKGNQIEGRKSSQPCAPLVGGMTADRC